jgi:hypothetical protein
LSASKCRRHRATTGRANNAVPFHTRRRHNGDFIVYGDKDFLPSFVEICALKPSFAEVYALKLRKVERRALKPRSRERRYFQI